MPSLVACLMLLEFMLQAGPTGKRVHTVYKGCCCAFIAADEVAEQQTYGNTHDDNYDADDCIGCCY